MLKEGLTGSGPLSETREQRGSLGKRGPGRGSGNGEGPEAGAPRGVRAPAGPECNASAAEERETPQPGTASGFYGDREEALGRGGMGADLREGGTSRRDTVQCDKSTAGHSGTGTGVRDVSPTGSPKQVGGCSGERHACAHRRARVSGRGEGKEENDS